MAMRVCKWNAFSCPSPAQTPHGRNTGIHVEPRIAVLLRGAPFVHGGCRAQHVYVAVQLPTDDRDSTHPGALWQAQPPYAAATFHMAAVVSGVTREPVRAPLPLAPTPNLIVDPTVRPDVRISSQGSRGRKGAPKRASEAVDGTFHSFDWPLPFAIHWFPIALVPLATGHAAFSLPHHLGGAGDGQRASFPRAKRRVNDRRRTPTWRLLCPQMCAPHTPQLP
jgi:hypothetical protein